jgi:hypothetical protein
LDYHWVETGNIQTEYFVRAISWNLEGTRLLLGGRLLQLWATKGTKESQEDIYSKNLPRSATFQLGAGNDGDSDDEDRETEAQNSNKSPQTGGNFFFTCWDLKLSYNVGKITCQMQAIAMNLRGKRAPQLPFG